MTVKGLYFEGFSPLEYFLPVRLCVIQQLCFLYNTTIHQLLIPLKDVTNILFMTYSMPSVNGAESFHVQEHHRVISGELQKKLYAFYIQCILLLTLQRF